jgi:hypothetical protein
MDRSETIGLENYLILARFPCTKFVIVHGEGGPSWKNVRANRFISRVFMYVEHVTLARGLMLIYWEQAVVINRLVVTDFSWARIINPGCKP